MKNGTLPEYKKGRHGKNFCLLRERKIAREATALILDMKPQSRTLAHITHAINISVIPKYNKEIEGGISESTVRKYMLAWGFGFKSIKKDVFVDGHEREDVVIYRIGWAKRMLEHRKQMDRFQDEVQNPIVGQKIVMVTHDESTFYANDGMNKIWLLNNMESQPLIPKGQGQSVMVSEFQCACHGTMKSPSDPNKTSRVLFEAGVNREGYWKSSDMQEQLKEVITIFEELHPGCKGLFLFDNSSNHSAFAADALKVARMTLNDKEISTNLDESQNATDKIKRWYPFRDTYYNINGRQYKQQIYRYINEEEQKRNK
jgi:hypothetical protein